MNNVVDNVIGNEEDKVPHMKKFPYGGIILIAIGVFALLEKLDIIPYLNWDLFWPLLLIFLGLSALYEYYQRNAQ